MAGIPHVHPHLWRHSFASNALKAGMSVSDLQTLLGHSNDTLIRSTYAKSVLEDVALDAARNLNLTRKLLDG